MSSCPKIIDTFRCIELLHSRRWLDSGEIRFAQTTEYVVRVRPGERGP